MTAEPTPETEIKSLHCNSCSRKTNHEVLAKHRLSGSSENDEVSWVNWYHILRCRGCEEVAFLHENYFSEDVEPVGYDAAGEVIYEHKPTVHAYPPRLARPIPKWIDDLPASDHELEDLVMQVYGALQNDSRWLTTVGTRTLLDYAMIRTVGDQGSFAATVKEFTKQGHLAPKLEKTLVDALDVGSAAAHRGYHPDPKELKDILDVVEAILVQIIVLPQRAASMAAATPQRPPKKATPKSDA